MMSRSKGGGGQRFRDNSNKASVIKNVTMDGEEVRNVQNCVTSFIYDFLA
jgi:hypothetical protein